MAIPGKECWTIVKRVFRYLCGTTNLVIYYHGNSEEVKFHGLVNSDWAGDINRRRSTSGYVFRLFGCVISWMSRKQSTVALSTIETEYNATTHEGKEAIGLQKLCIEIRFGQQVVRLECDSRSYS